MPAANILKYFLQTKGFSIISLETQYPCFWLLILLAQIPFKETLSISPRKAVLLSMPLKNGCHIPEAHSAISH